MPNPPRPSAADLPGIFELLEGRRLLATDLSFNFPNFADATLISSTLQLNVDAARDGSLLKLTNAARYSTGSTFARTPLTVTGATSFSTNFSFRMRDGGGSLGGDGIVFTIQDDAQGPAWIAQYPGGGIGYAGAYPSMGVELDSNRNGGDADGNHVGLLRHGDTYTHLRATTVGPDLNGGQALYGWIDYDGSTDLLRVYLATTAAKPATPAMTETFDLAGAVGTQGYVGFTSACGWEFNRNELLSWSFTTGTPEPNRPPVAVNDALTVQQNSGPTGLSVLANDDDPDGDALSVVGVGAAGHGSATTDGTRVFYTPATGYAGPDAFTYTISDGRGGTATATVNVTVDPAPLIGTLALEVGSYAVGENGGTVTIAVVRTGGSTGVATVDYYTVDQTAVANQDYVATAGTLRFESGEVRKTFTVMILDDAVVEPEETFAVSLDRVSGANLGQPRTALVRIADNDQPPPQGDELPWVENFTLTNGTTTDTGTTGWTTDRSLVTGGSFATYNNRFRATNIKGEGVWRSEVLSIAGRPQGADLSVVLQSGGTMETTGTGRDYVRVFYKLNGGPEVAIAQLDGNFNGNAAQTFTKTGLIGQNVQIVVRALNNASGEAYYWDDVAVRPSNPGPGAGGDGLRGQYFNNVDFTALALTRTDGTIDFNWGTGSPDATVDADTFSARWTGSVLPEFTETYTFHLTGDDGVRMWVSGVLLVDGWRDQGPTTYTGTIALTAGQRTNVTLEYYENGGGAVARLEWSSPSRPRQIIPRDRLFTQTVNEPPPTGTFRKVDVVTAGLASPTDLEFAADGRLFVAQKDGRIFVYQNGVLRSQPFIDLRDQVNAVRDRGLLGLAVHPQFPSQPYVYALFTYDPPEAAGGTGLAARDQYGNRAGRMLKITADPATGFNTALSTEVILGRNSTWANINGPDRDSTGDSSIPPSGVSPVYVEDFIATDSQSHSVGDVEFGPDGMLYVTLGDATSYGMVDWRSKYVQDLDTLRGKLLRIHPITGAGLSDNPFFNGNAGSNRSKIWSYGLRNPFRFTIRPSDGDVFVGDVGWNTWEELNHVDRQAAGGGGGQNFGWPWYEGGDTGNARTGGYRDLPEAIAFYNGGGAANAPMYARSHTAGARAFIAGDVYSAVAFPTAYRGALFFTDWGSKRVEAMTFDGAGNPAGLRPVLENVGDVTAMATGPDGWLWYVDHQLGRVGRIEYR